MIETAATFDTRDPATGDILASVPRCTGELVMSAPARQMRPVTLQLGGKSPSIVVHDADLGAILPTLRTAIIWNAGLTCDAQSRILVDQAIHGDSLDALTASFEELSIGPGIDDHDVGPLASAVQHERVSAHVDEARRTDGARLANNAGYDLAAAIWTKDIDRAFRIAGRVRARQVHINSYGLGSGMDLPFGGIRFSGIGREKGLRVLDESSALRTTTVQVTP
jgi:aldehyde dehydrogenase (NAD+)/betaine-aldehyde dehydrogenase